MCIRDRGIGTWVPTQLLDVEGTIHATSFTNSGPYTQTGSSVNSFSGNVGINSTAPGEALDVNGTVRITGTNGLNLGSDNKASITPSASTTPDLRFLTNSAEIMRITNAGNVGINSTAPGQALDVQGTIRTVNFTMSGQTPMNLSLIHI